MRLPCSFNLRAMLALCAVMPATPALAQSNYPNRPIRVDVRAGRLKALGVASLKRTTFAPELPTIAESGFPGFEGSTWYAFVAPRGTPPAAIAVLNREIAAALKTDTRDKIVALGVELAPSTPQEFANYMRAEVDKWRKIIKMAGIAEQ